jgi:hypothetical protein
MIKTTFFYIFLTIEGSKMIDNTNKQFISNRIKEQID